MFAYCNTGTKLKSVIPRGINVYAVHVCALVSFSGKKTDRCSSVGEHRSTAAREMPPEDCGIDSLRVACLLEKVASHETLLLLSSFSLLSMPIKESQGTSWVIFWKEGSRCSFCSTVQTVMFFFCLRFRIWFHLHLTMNKPWSLKAQSGMEVSKCLTSHLHLGW